MFYYPTRSGNPTKPRKSSLMVDLADEDGHCSDTCKEDEVESAHQNAVSVYWQDRLVPETQLASLPFFPDCRTQHQCEKESIPVGWRDRLHAFLFFGWDFKHISNNKLKFQVDPNLDEWLNDKKRYRDDVKTDPKHLTPVFLRCEVA